MKTKQLLYNNEFEVISETHGFINEEAHLVFVFSDRIVFEKIDIYKKVKKMFSSADIILLTTAGHLSNDFLHKDEIVISAITFEKSEVQTIQLTTEELQDDPDSINKYSCFFEKENLKSILVLSEGSQINGTELIRIISEKSDEKIPIYGGLAGDMERFEKTLVGLNESPKTGKIVLVGFYGNDIFLKFGIKGGWRDFGPEREVTHSVKNVLYKIGDYYALDLYKEYLGEYAQELPGASLYFPLSIKNDTFSEPLVRTVLSINEIDRSMTFAGDIPQGSMTKFMRSNSDDLLDACQNAALDALHDEITDSFVLVISCVGRRVVLGNRQDEELEIIKESLSKNSLITGFYSYGEIAPNINRTISCDLYNQSILVTTIYEK